MTSAERTARIAEIQDELIVVNKAISYVMKTGQSYTMMSSAGGGTQRMTTNASLRDLKDYKNQLRSELKTLQGESAFRMRAPW